MIRSLKTLGAVALALCAIGAISASSAWAVGSFTSPSGYPQDIVGVDVGADDFYTVSMFELRCAESFTGTLSGPSKQILVTPSYTNCTTPSGEEFTITTNGCQFRLNVTATSSKDQDKGTMDIVCPEGKPMEFHQYTTASHASSNCKITTGAQTGTGTLNYTSETVNGDILVHGTVEKMSSLLHGGCVFGFTLNGEASYHFGVTFKAASGQAVHVG